MPFRYTFIFFCKCFIIFLFSICTDICLRRLLLICKHTHPTHKLLDRVHSTVGGVGFEFEVSVMADSFDEIEYFNTVCDDDDNEYDEDG